MGCPCCNEQPTLTCTKSTLIATGALNTNNNERGGELGRWFGGVGGRLAKNILCKILK